MPEIIQVNKDQIVIAWQGDSNSVEYWPLGKTHLATIVTDDADTNTHEVRIRGLETGSHYSYKIVGKEDIYHVQTSPLQTSIISFMLFNDVTSDELLRHLISDNPGFLLCPSALNTNDTNEYSDIRPFVAVYDATGNTAQYLRDQPSLASTKGYRIEWGPLVLAVGEDKDFLQKQIDTLSVGYTLGLLTSGAIAQKLDFTPLAKHLESSSTIPGFVLVKDDVKSSKENGVTLVGIQADNTLFKVTVDTESAYMTEIPAGVQTDLRLAPLSTKRTCAECRRLADAGSYHASVTAYIEFIELNAEHHLIDDAYFEVANIYDEKLFDFTKATKWYSALVEAYPRSSLAPFATERLTYFKGFTLKDFPVLQRFEKIRRVSYSEADSQTKPKLIDEVLGLSDEGAKTALAPVMLYWVGNQQRQTDPERAVGTFRKLSAKYPAHGHAVDAVYAIAETLYEADRFEEARDSYKVALKKIPQREKSILAQIERCTRNIRRHFLIWPALIWLVCAVLLSLYFRRFHNRKNWIRAALVTTFMTVTFGIWGWTIREQFPSTFVLYALVLGSALVCGTAPAVVNPLILSPKLRGVTRFAVACILYTLTAAAGFFALVYFAFEHYLTVFGL